MTIAEIDRNILGNFLWLTKKSGQITDYREVQKYPLSPIPLILC